MMVFSVARVILPVEILSLLDTLLGV